MRHVTHPGPAAGDRLDLVPLDGRRIEVTLEADIPLQEAVGRAMENEGCDGGYLEIRDAGVQALDYVIPATAPDDDHVAWYSDIHSFGGPGRIDRLGMIVGQADGASFFHGHGRWTPEGGATAMGHILPPRAILSEPVQARGIGVTGATFARLHDPETNFDLFQTDGEGREGADHAILRIRPNVDFTTALEDACERLGWAEARAWGVGSVNHCDFADGTHLPSMPTEFYILDAPIRPAIKTDRGPEIDIVGTDGTDLRQGHVLRGQNPVLITAEIVLARTDRPT